MAKKMTSISLKSWGIRRSNAHAEDNVDEVRWAPSGPAAGDGHTDPFGHIWTRRRKRKWQSR